MTNKKDKLKVISLFSGCGGMDLGFEQTNQFEIVGAVEFDKTIAESYKKNNPKTNVFIGDITKLDINEVNNTINSKIDCIIGGPPCQGFSTRGKCLGKEDIRNYLFEQFFKYTDFFKPKYFVIENVAAILGTEGGYFRNLILEEAKQQNYHISYGILEAKYFQIPQIRRRAFFIGCKTNKVDLPKMNKDNKQTTVWDAISDLSYLNSNEGTFESEYRIEPQTEYQKEMRKNSTKLYNHIATNHSLLAIKRLSMIPPEKGKEYLPKEHLTKSTFGSTWGRLVKNDLSPTIITRFDTPSNGRNNHPYLNRAITPREAARLQSFPDSFIFYGHKTSVIKQIGNAVPPRLARAVAEQIIRNEDDNK